MHVLGAEENKLAVALNRIAQLGDQLVVDDCWDARHLRELPKAFGEDLLASALCLWRVGKLHKV